MATCKKVKYKGKDVPLYFFIGCEDVRPADNQFKRLGALRGKEIGVSWDSIDATADDSVGSLRENIASYQSLTISGDAVCKNSGVGAAEAKEFAKHVINPVATGGEPFVWLKIVFPDITITAYMMMSNYSRSATYDDLVTWAFEAAAAPSDYGLIVEDTPDPDAPAVSGVTVTPDVQSIAVGATSQLTAAVTPSGAPSGVVWTTSDADVATVSVSGLVTGVSAGSATITATAIADGTKTDTAAITVTA